MDTSSTFTLPKHSMKFHNMALKRKHKAVWDNPANILDDLYLSSLQPAQDAALLKALGVRFIVSATAYVTHPAGIEVLSLDIEDKPDEDISVHFPAVNKAIDEHLSRSEPVLVHCMAGASRSVALILSFLVYKGISLRDSFEHVIKCRPSACPNPGFMEQLGMYEKTLHGLETPTYSREDLAVDKLAKGVGKGLNKSVLREILVACDWDEEAAVFEIFQRKRKRKG